MNRTQLFEQIKKKRSYLCVGLDTDLNKIPKHLLSEADPVFSFNKIVIDATKDLCIAYKPNLAFYEALGPKGLESLQKTIEYIPDEIFTIADAKRGDIGNTSLMYAKAFYDELNFDAITLSPYMGEDSISPYLQYNDKWVILLALTSNKGSSDFQKLMIDDKPLYDHVMYKSASWGSSDQIMYVVGATQPDSLKIIRENFPDHFLLIPGVGAQGGDLEVISKNGFNSDCGLIVNSSRGIIYGSDELDFEMGVNRRAKKIQSEMSRFLSECL